MKLLCIGCIPVAIGLWGYRYQSVLGSTNIPTVGTFYSQAGNVLFPTWEYLRALMVAIAGIKAGLFSARGHLLKNRWQLLADKSQVS